MILIIVLSVVCVFLLAGTFCVFFDQAVLTRRETIYRVDTNEKKVALTFDDGPSPVWTPLILDELKKAGIKATFFMIGYHVNKYPDVARRVAEEGHEVASHGYAHSVMLYYTPAEIEQELKYTEHVIKEVTGVSTTLFRPPKAWLRKTIKAKIKSMGYDIILWSLNSKDWVRFNHHRVVNYLLKNVKNGDIILFHDSGHAFAREGGNRLQTVKAVSLLARKLKERGFQIVPVGELTGE